VCKKEEKLFFQEKFVPKVFSESVECSFDNTAKNFLTNGQKLRAQCPKMMRNYIFFHKKFISEKSSLNT